jgi:hypothetical protein
MYLSIYPLGRNDFVYSNVGNLNRFESAALQFVGFCFHHNNKIADSLFAICSLQGLFFHKQAAITLAEAFKMQTTRYDMLFHL